MKASSRRQTNASPRRGVTLVITVFVAIIFMAMLAHAVDVGYMCAVKTQMQAAADSAAHAGVQKLMSDELLQGHTDPTTGIADARTQAANFAALHPGGGVTLTADHNTGNASDGDIVVGTIAQPFNANSPFVPGTTSPNSVQVTIHRNATRNGNLGLSFARIWGTTSVGLQATATATIQGGIQGFRINENDPTRLPKLLPLAMDIDVWTNQVINRNGPDAWSYDRATNAVTSATDGIHEAKLFPTQGQAPGNFGTIDIGSASNGTNELVRQILHGPNDADFAHYSPPEFKLGQNGTLATEGDTGVSAGISDALNAIIGQPRAIALYRGPITRTGNTAQFTIVAFAGIIITEVVLSGNDKHVTIQPEFLIDPTGIGGGSGSSSSFIYKGIYLTR